MQEVVSRWSGAPSETAALRSLLADGGWHAEAKLRDIGGLTWRARLREIRAGLDGGEPWGLVERRCPGQDAIDWRAFSPGADSPAPRGERRSKAQRKLGRVARELVRVRRNLESLAERIGL
jgi:hypothetical protein